MRASPGLMVILQLAAREAAGAGYDRIEPEHLLMALMDLAVGAEEAFRGADLTQEHRSSLQREAAAIREEFHSREIAPAEARPRLREAMGPGEGVPEGRRIHRSPASRSLFVQAGELAAAKGEKSISSTHLMASLLRAPTPMIAAALTSAAPRDRKTAASPTHGRRDGAADGSQPPPAAALRPACTALLRAVSRTGGRRTVLLVSDDEGAAEQVMSEAAEWLEGEEGKRRTGSRPVTDLRELGAVRRDDAAAVRQLTTRLEAVSDSAAVVLAPSIRASRDESGDGWEGMEALARLLERRGFTFVASIEPVAWQAWSRRDPGWRSRAEVMFVGAGPADEVPAEL